MNIMYLLIPIAIVFSGLAIWGFFWSVNSGQYDDLDTEGHRILFEEPTTKPTSGADDLKTKEDNSPNH